MTDGPRTPLGLKYQLENQRIPFSEEQLLQLVVNQTGVYALWVPNGGPDECLYVGMSDTCLRRRLTEHLKWETNRILRPLLSLYRDIVEFSTALTGNEDEILSLEDDIIKDWKPVANRRGIKREL